MVKIEEPLPPACLTVEQLEVALPEAEAALGLASAGNLKALSKRVDELREVKRQKEDMG